MIKPNAKLIASRSASVTAGTALPASVSVAITEPGPTRTNAAVPNVSAIARCDIECMVADPLNLTSVRQCRIDFTNRSPARVVCQQAIWAVKPRSSRQRDQIRTWINLHPTARVIQAKIEQRLRATTDLPRAEFELLMRLQVSSDRRLQMSEIAAQLV